MGVVTSALSARPNEERDEVKRWAERYSFCVFLAFFCLVSDSLLSTWKKPLEWTGWLPIISGMCLHAVEDYMVCYSKS